MGRMIREMAHAVDAAVWQAYTRWRRGEDLVGHILSLCKAGRHRSYFAALVLSEFFKLVGIPYGRRVHHARVLREQGL